MASPGGLQFVGLADQEPLTGSERLRAIQAAEWIRGLLEHRESRIRELGLDPAIWLPAANWALTQPFYEASRNLMRGENVECLRLTQQFTGYALWLMSFAGGEPLPPQDIGELGDAVLKHASCPDEISLYQCGRLRAELPDYLRIGPPAKLGEVGWMVDGVIVNHDTKAYWERLLLLYRAGLLDRKADRCLKPGSRILEIGAGYGGLAYYIQRTVPDVRYTVLDIPETLVYSAIYLSVLNPDAETRFLPNYEFPRLVEDKEHFDLVINTLSMSEMSEQQVRAYCEGIRALIGASGVFFEQNQDCRHLGLLNARDVVRDYFSGQQALGGRPQLEQGSATVWSNPAPGVIASA